MRLNFLALTQITLPNPYLKAEHATGREVGLEWQPAGWAELKGTWYVADYRDFNVPVTLGVAGGVTTRQRLNVSKSRSRGGEAYLALRPVSSLFVSGSVNYDDARVVSGPAGTVVGAHINRVPSPKQTVRATWTTTALGAWTVIGRHEGHTTTLQGAWLDPYTGRRRERTARDRAGHRRLRRAREHRRRALPDQPDRHGGERADLVRHAADAAGRVRPVAVLSPVCQPAVSRRRP